MPGTTKFANELLSLSGFRKPLKWKNSVCLDCNARRVSISLTPGWYLLHASPRDTDTGQNPTGHTLTIDLGGEREQLLLSSSHTSRRIIQIKERLSYVIASLEDSLDPSLCLELALSKITHRRASQRMLKRMTRRFDPLQHKNSIDNIEHVQTDMLRSHGHWPSLEDLYQVYQQSNQRDFTPRPYSNWLEDHLLALANHWRKVDWHEVATDRLRLQLLTLNEHDITVWEESIQILQSILGARTPSIQISSLSKLLTTNADLSQFTHIVLAGSGVVASTEFLIALIRVLSRDEHCALLYTDHDRQTKNQTREHPVIKPGWDPYLLETGNYIGDLCVCSTELYLRTGGLNPHAGDSAIHDFLMRARQQLNRNQVIHLPGIMFSQADRPGSSACQDRWFTHHGDEPPQTANTLLQTKNLENPPPRVEIIIPTRDKETLLRQCVESILSITDYPNYHITVVDNDSSEEATTRFHHSMDDDARYGVLHYPGTFNYSAINNYAVSRTQSDVLLLLNNDTQIVQADWLSRMVQACMLPRIGCVGAKLLYANGRIQHAGVVMGMKGVAGHAYRFQKGNSASYLHKLHSPHQVSAVTAACLAVRRDTYQQLGGLDDKELTVAFNDVDFCLRAHSAGFDNLLLSDVSIVHHESLSRGKDESPDKAARFAAECKVMHQRWKQYIHRDPYWNPLLSLVEEQPMLEAAPPPVA